MSKPVISAIAAIGKNRELGKDGKIPWKIPGEQQYFKAVTLGHPIIMGRKTHESIGRALPGRVNMVITRSPGYRADGCVVVSSVEDAILEAKKHDQEEIFVIGGGEIYRAAMPYLDKLYLTHVEGTFDADTFFPDYSEFKEVSRTEPAESDGHVFIIAEYVRN
ncbi:MAG: dihydrofolate reductase [Parcubacteria group bacterium]|nr:dihydrofolate reductase [Parcubacteria group bacterium]